MDTKRFEEVAAEEWDKVPEQYRTQMQNIALIIEDEPSEAIKKEDHLTSHQTLLGRYHGLPLTVRGEGYGIGGTLPDTITLFRLPMLAHAEHTGPEKQGDVTLSEDSIRTVIRETIWHEIGHYFGLDDPEIREREEHGSNKF